MLYHFRQMLKEKAQQEVRELSDLDLIQALQGLSILYSRLDEREDIEEMIMKKVYIDQMTNELLYRMDV